MGKMILLLVLVVLFFGIVLLDQRNSKREPGYRNRIAYQVWCRMNPNLSVNQEEWQIATQKGVIK